MTYVGAVPTTGDFKKLDAITASATATYNLRQGGVAVYPQSSSHCLVVLNGILQTGGSSFNIVNDTIVFAEALTSSDVINQILVLGNVNDIGVPSDDTVSTAKIQADAINATKIADDSISDEHLDITAITGQTEKTSLVDADKFLISDSADSGALKYVQNSNLGGGAMTLLEQKIGTSNVSNLVFENKFSNTYTRYIIYIDYMYNGTTNTHLRYKFRKSDGSGGYEDETRVGYTYTIAGRRSGADEFNSESSGGATDFGRLTPMITRSGGEHGLKAVLEIYRPGTVDSQACMTYIQGRGMYRSYINDSSMAAHFNSSSNNYHTDAFLGIKLYFSSGDIDDYKVTLYGVTT